MGLYSKWFGRFQQDYFVSRVLDGKRQGFFVDLAAGHAIEDSTTYALETYYGWTGICVEADSNYWESLSFRSCDLVGAIVGETQMEERIEAKGFIEPRLRHTVPLRDILERFEAPRVIDYLSIRRIDDQHVIFKSFPFDR